MFRSIISATGCVALTVLVGCGGGFSPDAGVIVTGKVIQGGQPAAVPPTPDGYDGVEVQFFPASPTDTKLASTTSMCDATGAFEINYAGTGIPPGKYKVGVFLRKGGPGTDLLEGKLSNEVTTIEFDVPKEKLGGKHDVGTIDIATYLK